MIALNQQQQQRSHRLIMSASVARFLLVALVALWAFNMATVSVMAQSANATDSPSQGNASTTTTPSPSTASNGLSMTGSGTSEMTTLPTPEASTPPSGSMSVWASGSGKLDVPQRSFVLLNYLLFSKVAAQ
ncbi:hypothetical protein TYRP_016638 [Tyrophagus putrescentiae]|nr:hypothetical protein TYRP_016638 [Tyrophagus putrescentiae]